MSPSLSRVVSILFHPVFMSLYGLFILFHSESFLNYNTPGEAKRFLYLFMGMLTVVMPVVSMLILLRNKMISSLSMPERRERNLPYIVTTFYYLLLYYLLYKIQDMPPALLSVLTGSIFVLVLLTLFNQRFKISAHAAGAAGVAGLYIGLSADSVILPHMGVLSLILLGTGVVCSARLTSGDHSPAEVYAGALTGFTVEYLVTRNLYFL